jgi:hypothetical protein
MINYTEWRNGNECELKGLYQIYKSVFKGYYPEQKDIFEEFCLFCYNNSYKTVFNKEIRLKDNNASQEQEEEIYKFLYPSEPIE